MTTTIATTTQLEADHESTDEFARLTRDFVNKEFPAIAPKPSRTRTNIPTN